MKDLKAMLINEALEQVAKDIRAKTGSGITAKGVNKILNNGNDKSIAICFTQYLGASMVALGLTA